MKIYIEFANQSKMTGNIVATTLVYIKYLFEKSIVECIKENDENTIAWMY